MDHGGAVDAAQDPLPLPLIAPFVAIGGAIASGVLVAVVLAR